VFGNDHYVLYFTDARDSENLLIVAGAARLSELDLHLIKVFCTNVGIAFENLHLHQDLVESQVEMVCLLAGAAETRSQESASHVRRVGLLAEFFAREYGLDDKAAEALRFAAPLHDIGKIAVPDAVLLKEGELDPHESRVMRKHPIVGDSLCSGLRSLNKVRPIVRHHHERLDGTGYPDGLRNGEVPLLAQIVGVVDVFDALTTERPYRGARPAEEAFQLLADESSKGWRDRALVDTFANLITATPA
jgi:putative nucleotidyltransferase with HDIG domain